MHHTQPSELQPGVLRQHRARSSVAAGNGVHAPMSFGVLLQQSAVEHGANVQRGVEQGAQVDGAGAASIQTQRMLKVAELLGGDVLDHVLKDVTGDGLAGDLHLIHADKHAALIQRQKVEQLVFMSSRLEHGLQHRLEFLQIPEYLQTSRLGIQISVRVADQQGAGQFDVVLVGRVNLNLFNTQGAGVGRARGLVRKEYRAQRLAFFSAHDQIQMLEQQVDAKLVTDHLGKKPQA